MVVAPYRLRKSYAKQEELADVIYERRYEKTEEEQTHHYFPSSDTFKNDTETY